MPAHHLGCKAAPAPGLVPGMSSIPRFPHIPSMVWWIRQIESQWGCCGHRLHWAVCTSSTRLRPCHWLGRLLPYRRRRRFQT